MIRVISISSLSIDLYLISSQVIVCVNYTLHTVPRMANSALKCRIIILITASSLCSYNNILINFGQLYNNSCYTTLNIATLGMCIYSMWISSTLDSDALYLSHISALHQMTCFCRTGHAGTVLCYYDKKKFRMVWEISVGQPNCTCQCSICGLDHGSRAGLSAPSQETGPLPPSKGPSHSDSVEARSCTSKLPNSQREQIVLRTGNPNAELLHRGLTLDSTMMQHPMHHGYGLQSHPLSYARSVVASPTTIIATASPLKLVSINSWVSMLSYADTRLS